MKNNVLIKKYFIRLSIIVGITLIFLVPLLIINSFINSNDAVWFLFGKFAITKLRLTYIVIPMILFTFLTLIIFTVLFFLKYKITKVFSIIIVGIYSLLTPAFIVGNHLFSLMTPGYVFWECTTYETNFNCNIYTCCDNRCFYICERLSNGFLSIITERGGFYDTMRFENTEEGVKFTYFAGGEQYEYLSYKYINGHFIYVNNI